MSDNAELHKIHITAGHDNPLFVKIADEDDVIYKYKFRFVDERADFDKPGEIVSDVRLSDDENGPGVEKESHLDFAEASVEEFTEYTVVR